MAKLEILFYALAGGIFPALLWLWFWLREDGRHPEPGRTILRTFLLGMLSVVLVLPFQKLVSLTLPDTSVAAFVLWAILEEVFKFMAAYWGGLKSVDDNEPIDPIIYMITAALGFVALENTLYLLGPLLNGDLAHSILTGNMRFIGASLLHIFSSGVVGVALALSFYKKPKIRSHALTVGLTLGIAFHIAFNLLLIKGGDISALVALLMVWFSIVVLLLLFEKAKTVAP